MGDIAQKLKDEILAILEEPTPEPIPYIPPVDFCDEVTALDTMPYDHQTTSVLAALDSIMTRGSNESWTLTDKERRWLYSLNESEREWLNGMLAGLRKRKENEAHALYAMILSTYRERAQDEKATENADLRIARREMYTKFIDSLIRDYKAAGGKRNVDRYR